jgi:hypothetical protein
MPGTGWAAGQASSSTPQASGVIQAKAIQLDMVRAEGTQRELGFFGGNASFRND